MLDLVLKVDTELFLFLNGIHSPFFDPIMIFFSAKFTWLPLYFIIVMGMYIKFGWRLVWPLVGVAIVVVLADQSSVHLFKNIFERLRPCHNKEINELIHLAAGRCYGRYGFVSSHAANTFGVAIFLSYLFRVKWFTLFILSWAAIVSYSRIYLGVHYPLDIICGGLLGALCGYIVWITTEKIHKATGFLWENFSPKL